MCEDAALRPVLGAEAQLIAGKGSAIEEELDVAQKDTDEVEKRPVLPMELICRIAILSFGTWADSYEEHDELLSHYSCLRLVSRDVLGALNSRALHQRSWTPLSWNKAVACRLLKNMDGNRFLAQQEMEESIALQQVRRLEIVVRPPPPARWTDLATRFALAGSSDSRPVALECLLAVPDRLVALTLHQIDLLSAAQLDLSRLHALELLSVQGTRSATIDLSTALQLRYLEIEHDDSVIPERVIVVVPQSLKCVRLSAWSGDEGVLEMRRLDGVTSFTARLMGASERLVTHLGAVLRAARPLRHLAVHHVSDERSFQQLNVRDMEALEQLSIWGNEIATPEALGLQSLTRLVALNIGHNPLSTILFLDLSTNTSLRYLGLTSVHSTCWQHDLPILARQLRSNSTLEVLDLSCCQLQDADLADFDIGTSKGLLQLDMHGNPFREAGLRALKLEQKERIEVWLGTGEAPRSIPDKVVDGLCTLVRRISRERRETRLRHEIRPPKMEDFL